MTVQQIINCILNEFCGDVRIDPTCDIIASGSPDTEVTGIITTMFPTVEVIQETIKRGANFIIAHEPTWFNGMDKTGWCENDSVYLAKKKLLDENGIAVWRFHDHMHFGSAVDYIYQGFMDEMDWHQYLQPDEKEPWVYKIPEITLKELALQFKEQFEMDAIRVIGKPDCKIRRVGVLVGGGSLGLGREVMPMEVMERNHLNVLVCGDITEWTTVEYINDAQQLGMDRCMIQLGHERSEEAGMKHLPVLLRRFLPDIPVQFVSSNEPYTYF